jgi:hypothetical protein
MNALIRKLEDDLQVVISFVGQKVLKKPHTDRHDLHIRLPCVKICKFRRQASSPLKYELMCTGIAMGDGPEVLQV